MVIQKTERSRWSGSSPKRYCRSTAIYRSSFARGLFAPDSFIPVNSREDVPQNSRMFSPSTSSSSPSSSGEPRLRRIFQRAVPPSGHRRGSADGSCLLIPNRGSKPRDDREPTDRRCFIAVYTHAAADLP